MFDQSSQFQPGDRVIWSYRPEGSRWGRTIDVEGVVVEGHATEPDRVLIRVRGIDGETEREVLPAVLRRIGGAV